MSNVNKLLGQFAANEAAINLYCERRYGRRLSDLDQGKVDAYVDFLLKTENHPLAKRNRKQILQEGLLPAATHLLKYIETTTEDERSKHRTELYLVRGY